MPRNAILARNLGQIVESIQSLPRHHYGLFMIDYTNKNYAGSSFFEEAVKRYSPFTGTSYEAGVTDESPLLSVTASYALDGENVTEVNMSVNTQGVWSALITGVQDGAVPLMEITVIATDERGNSSEAPWSLGVIPCNPAG